MKCFKTILHLFIILIALSGCSTSKEKTSNIPRGVKEEKLVRNSITINPSASYEECIELYPGVVLDYEFNASEFIDFNIHYHGTDDIHYPVSNKGVVKGKGMIDPGTHSYYTGEQEYYCLMWDNINDEPVKISFTCVLRGN